MPTDKNIVPYFLRKSNNINLNDSTVFLTNGFKGDTIASISYFFQIFKFSKYVAAQFYSCFK